MGCSVQRIPLPEKDPHKALALVEEAVELMAEVSECPHVCALLGWNSEGEDHVHLAMELCETDLSRFCVVIIAGPADSLNRFDSAVAQRTGYRVPSFVLSRVATLPLGNRPLSTAGHGHPCTETCVMMLPCRAVRCIEQDNARLETHDRLHMMKQMAQGLQFLHSRAEGAVVHGDLKPENVLLTEDREVRSDRGFAAVIL